MHRTFTVLAGAFITLQPSAVFASPLPGPVPAEVMEVIDGDTVEVRAHIWPGHYVHTRVRLAGVDTPERRGADCDAERAAAAQATAFTTGWLTASRPGETGFAPIWLHEVETGSFAGRVIARIRRADNSDLSRALIDTGLATVYGAPEPWCETASDPTPTDR